MNAELESEPQPIADRVVEIAAKAEKARLDRMTPEAVQAYDDGDFAAEARVLRLERRETFWRRVIPPRFHKAALADLGAQSAEEIQVWVTHLPPIPNLVIVGPIGTGKTHAAIAATKPAFTRGLDVRFCPVVELMDLLRPGGPDNVWEDLTLIDRLILDDVGSERTTDWTAERFYALINRRWLDKAPIVATSNLQLSELERSLEPRTFSRLMDRAVIVQMSGRDRRRDG